MTATMDASSPSGTRHAFITYSYLIFSNLLFNSCANRSTIERGRGCNKFVPVLRENGTKIVPIGDMFDQLPSGMSWIRGKLVDHVGDHVVLSPGEGVLGTSPGTESSYPRPPQSLNNSRRHRNA